MFLGPDPASVVAQYQEVVGQCGGGVFLGGGVCVLMPSRGSPGYPAMPIYWALGYHLCRWGYGDDNSTWEIVKHLRNYGIPQVEALFAPVSWGLLAV